MGGVACWEQFARWQKHPYITMDLSENCYTSCLRESDWYSNYCMIENSTICITNYPIQMPYLYPEFNTRIILKPIETHLIITNFPKIRSKILKDADYNSACCFVWMWNLVGVFENMVLSVTFGHKRDDITGEWKGCIAKSFIICTIYQILLGWSNQGMREGRNMWHV